MQQAISSPTLSPALYLRERGSKAGRLLIAAALLCIAFPTHAIQPGEWVQETEAEFTEGEPEGTVVTNLGDVKLAASDETLAELGDRASIVYDIQVVDGVTYLAAGPEGKLLKWDGNEATEVAAFEDEQVFTLDIYKGELLAAISGTTSRLALLSDDGLSDLAKLEDVRYVWDLVVDGDAIIAATGTEGRVLRIDLTEADEPTIEPILETEQVNILCLARHGDDGPIYAGTDTDGLVYRLTPGADGQWSSFVVYDAAEPEIGAMLIRGDGTLFVGTADANQARPGRLDEATSEETGRPEAGEAEPEAGDEDEAPAPDPGDLPEVPPSPDPISDEDPAANPEEDEQATTEESADAAEEADAEPAPVPETKIIGIDDPGALAEEADTATPGADASNTDVAPTDATDGPSESSDAEPTSEQRDRLRELVRSRLEAARRSGKLQSPGGVPPGGQRGGMARARGTAPGPQASAPQEGNAIYRIDTQGFVTEVFRESVMILRMIESPTDDGTILVATGSEAQVFRVDPKAGETTIVADLEPEQVPAMLAVDGGVLLGTANPAELVRLGDTIAKRGTYTSAPLDAAQVSLWGAMRVTANIPDGASMTIETRSGNVADPETAPWSDWSDAQVQMPNAEQPALQPRQVTIKSPPARFLQYRLTLTASPDGDSPAVDRVATTYVTPNLRPKIDSIMASYPEAQPLPAGPGTEEPAPPATMMSVTWEATDPNNDRLLYTLEYQRAGAEAWVAIAEDVEATSFEWQTRRAPDGWYLLHVIASDRLDNPPDMAKTTTRRSGPVLVDNTAPTFEEVTHAVDGDKVTIKGLATDDWSPIRAIGYVVDSAELYEPILPEDLIFDSTRESFIVTIPDLAPGPHVVTLRVADTRGNLGYHAVTINPGKK